MGWIEHNYGPIDPAFAMGEGAFRPRVLMQLDMPGYDERPELLPDQAIRKLCRIFGQMEFDGRLKGDMPDGHFGIIEGSSEKKWSAVRQYSVLWRRLAENPPPQDYRYFED